METAYLLARGGKGWLVKVENFYVVTNLPAKQHRKNCPLPTTQASMAK
jgi:hypothetical protein